MPAEQKPFVVAENHGARVVPGKGSALNRDANEGGALGLALVVQPVGEDPAQVVVQGVASNLGQESPIFAPLVQG
jgi:hypothetical protein